jgi:hypothetical protein
MLLMEDEGGGRSSCCTFHGRGSHLRTLLVGLGYCRELAFVVRRSRVVGMDLWRRRVGSRRARRVGRAQTNTPRRLRRERARRFFTTQ